MRRIQKSGISVWPDSNLLTRLVLRSSSPLVDVEALFISSTGRAQVAPLEEVLLLHRAITVLLRVSNGILGQKRMGENCFRSVKMAR